MRRPSRAQAGALFLLLYSTISMASVVVKEWARPPHPPLVPLLGSEQIARIRSLVPARSTIGFLSDETDPTSSWSSRGPKYVWTQYDLAPIVIALSTEYPLVLVRCEDGKRCRELARREGLLLANDLGGGVMLYERRPR